MRQHSTNSMYSQLDRIFTRPTPFEVYSAKELWTDEHISAQMLNWHLDGDVDVSSRKLTFIDQSVEWITSRFNVAAGTRVADFGCGPGLYTVRLAERGADVTGIDFSKRSIHYAEEQARNQGLSIRYLHQDYLETDIEGAFDLILMIMCDFCVLSPARRKQLLRTFRRILHPGGHVLLDVYSLVAFAQSGEEQRCEYNLMDGFWSPKPYFGFLNRFTYPDECVTLDKYTIIERDRIRTVFNWLQYFSPESIDGEFKECGFSTEFYGNVAGAPFSKDDHEFAVVARVE